jgi:RNA polymerase sigma-70 factor (ECF subfamily)
VATLPGVPELSQVRTIPRAGGAVFVPSWKPQLFVRQRVEYNVEVMARSDVQLMLDVKAGDDASFEPLLRKYRTPLVNFLYRMVRDSAAAEDLAQEVFLRVYRARKDYLPSAKFTTWMFRIATNLALNAKRDGRYRQIEVPVDQPADSESDLPALEIADTQPTVEHELIIRDRAAMIRRAVEALPEKQRVAVLLHKYQEMDYDDIAKVLNCSESALKSLLFRAYQTLRVELAPLVEPSGPAKARCGRE